MVMIKYFFIVSMMLASTLGFSQEETVNNLKDAIKIGNSREVSKFFGKTIDLAIEGTSNEYSRTHAEGVLKDFFKKYPIAKFEIIHRGNSKGGLVYVIGQYTYSEGSFRVLIRLKLVAGNYQVHELSFIKE